MSQKGFLTFLLVFAVVLGLWALFHKKPESSTPSTSMEVQNQPPQSPSHPASQSIPQTPSPVAPTPSHSRSHASNTVIIEGVPISQDVIDYTRKSLADPQYDWKQPINFYGKVVDENDAPVPGASIHFDWTTL